jgi:predicted transcriptional regulator
MKLSDLVKMLDGTLLVGADRLDLEIDHAFAADLLSDVLALTDERTTLITGMVNPQVMRVAEILNMTAVILVRGKTPPPALVEYAKGLNIPFVTTRKTMFETCGRMFAQGVRPCRTVGASETGTCE